MKNSRRSAASSLSWLSVYLFMIVPLDWMRPFSRSLFRCLDALWFLRPVVWQILYFVKAWFGYLAKSLRILSLAFEPRTVSMLEA